ncbi:MAG: ATP-binding protein [Bacteroidales bacterium]|nr:ATP-binding protein [Bacteroidales bacterium]
MTQSLGGIKYISFLKVLATFLISMLCIIAPSISLAQTKNNSFQIDDECYQYMLKINKVLDKPVSIAMCDTLRLIAQKKHDIKAECISYSQMAIHYTQTNNDKLIKEFPFYKSFIEKTPYLQYLYSCWGNLCFLYSKTGKLNESVKEIEKMRNDAISRNNKNGIAKSYDMIGVIYFNQRDFKAASQNFLKVYEIYKELGDKNIYKTEIRLAQCYDDLGEMELCSKMIKQSVLHTPPAYEISTLTSYLYIINRNPHYFPVDEFERIKDRIDQIQSNSSTNETANTFNATISDFYSKKCSFEKALEYADKIKNPEVRNYQKLLVFQRMEKWDSAFVYSMEKNKMDQQHWQEKNAQYLASAAASIDSSHLALEKDQLLIKQLQDQKKLLELESQQQKLKIKNSNLELENKNRKLMTKQQELRLNKLNDEKKDQHIKQMELEHKYSEEQRIREKQKTLMLLALMTVTLISSLFITRLISKSRSRIKKEKDAVIKAHKEEQKQTAIALEALNNAEESRIRAKKAQQKAEESQMKAEIAQKQAEKADNIKTLFLQNMSHEIRTPLNAIVGFSDVLTSPEMVEMMDEEERNEMNRLIHVNSEMLLTLVNDILDISKLESGTYKLALSDVDANEMCSDALQSIKGREETGVNLLLRLPHKSTVFRTDRQRVQQVLINFLTNACKNTSTGKITLGYDMVGISDKPYLRFFVEDTGNGIPRDKIETIFKRFEKLDNFKQGTGLGLNICQLICNTVKGNIYVDASYTNGARFVFEHPFETSLS